MARDMLFNQEARAKIKAGVNALADAVRITVGPKGRNVALYRGYGQSFVTNDGVTIAKEIEPKDYFENMGANLVKQAAIQTNEAAGDGTTTATILAQAIINEGMKNVEAGANPMAIRRGIEKATAIVVAELKEQSTTVSGIAETTNVATISSGDPEIGKTIAEAYAKIGVDGVLTIDKDSGLGLRVEIVEGMQVDNGYASAHFVTDKNKMRAVLERPLVLVTDYQLHSVVQLVPILEQIAKTEHRAIFVVADSIESDALGVLVFNHIQGAFKALAINAPAFGDRRKELLEDIAIATGATFISEMAGIPLTDVTVDMLGRAERIIASRDTTLIIEGAGDKDLVQGRIDELKERAKASQSSWDKEQFTSRLAKISGGIGVIKVGGATEGEQREKQLRVEDAVGATKAALEEGIVAGGGIALINARAGLAEYLVANPFDEEEAVGAQIVYRALAYPLMQIVKNAGQNGEMIVEKVEAEKDSAVGYNAANDKVENLIKAGVIDPVKVTRLALQNAASIAALILTTECVVSEVPEPKKMLVVEED